MSNLDPDQADLSTTQPDSRWCKLHITADCLAKLREQETVHENRERDYPVDASPNVPDTDFLHPDTNILNFGAPPSTKSLAGLHPQPMNIFRLWQTFLDNVNPLTKVIHAPTVQQQVLEASGHIDTLSRSMESLMFAIYACAVTSMTDAECHSILGEARLSVLNRYRYATWQSLLGAAFIKASDMVLLQAFTLYLVSQIIVPCCKMGVDSNADLST